ncbi:hypothetical protein Hanom_Chr00s023535g01762751 [Helianthus anomalus]
MLTTCKSNLVSQQFNINMNLEIVIVHTRLIAQAFFHHIAQSHQQLSSKPHNLVLPEMSVVLSSKHMIKQNIFMLKL